MKAKWPPTKPAAVQVQNKYDQSAFKPRHRFVWFSDDKASSLLMTRGEKRHEGIDPDNGRHFRHRGARCYRSDGPGPARPRIRPQRAQAHSN